MKKLLLCALSSLVLVGCAAKTVTLKSTFNEAQAKQLLSNGNNQITGSAFVRQNGGNVVTCAGQTVNLIPSTDFTKERMGYIYNSTEKGFVPFNMFNELPVPKFANEPSNYKSYSRQTVCDAQGNFNFDKLANGDFYIVSIVRWDIGNASMDFGARQGGALMQKVSVSNGETKKVLLVP